MVILIEPQGLIGQNKKMELTPVKKRRILYALGFVVFMQLYCFKTNKELYPFAPFLMYSYPFTLPVHTFHLEAAGEDHTFTVLASIGGYKENPLSEILKRGFRGRFDPQQALHNILRDCGQSKMDCQTLWQNHEGARASQIKVLRGIRETYLSVIALAEKRPDKTETIVEIYNEH